MADQLPPQISKPTPDSQGSAGVSPQLNPANDNSIAAQIARGERKRLPVSSGRRKLEVPEIPGFNLYWFLARNVQAALEGGYEFVDAKDTVLIQHNPASASDTSGNTDLGSRVSIATTGADGAERLYLMKIRLEWYQEDQAAIQAKNMSVLQAIFRDDFVFASSGKGEQGGTVPQQNTDPNTYFHESNRIDRPGKKALFNRLRKGVA